MNFEQAVKAYQANPDKEELKKLCAALRGEMNLNEKVIIKPNLRLVEGLAYIAVGRNELTCR